MKHRYQIPLFAFYDHTGMSCHVEKMARRGWMVDKLGNFLWRYRAIEPQRLRFSIVYFPEVTGFEPGKAEGHPWQQGRPRPQGHPCPPCRGQEGQRAAERVFPPAGH